MSHLNQKKSLKWIQTLIFCCIKNKTAITENFRQNLFSKWIKIFPLSKLNFLFTSEVLKCSSQIQFRSVLKLSDLLIPFISLSYLSNAFHEKNSFWSCSSFWKYKSCGLKLKTRKTLKSLSENDSKELVRGMKSSGKLVYPLKWKV